MQDDKLPLFFALFNEINIIGQLSRAALEAQLPDGLIQPHFGVLNHLIRVGDGTTPMRIARAFQVPKTSMTHTLAGLEKRGLIEMRPNPEDARSKCVWITESGRALRDETIQGLAAGFAPLVAEFAPERAAAILPELTALREIMDAARS